MTSPRVLIVFLALLHIYVCNAIQQSGLSATLKTSIEAEDYDRPQRSGLIFGRRRRSTKSLTAGGVASFAAVSTCSVSGCGSAGSRVYQQQSSSIASTLLLRGGTLRSRIIRSGNKNAAGGNNKKDDKNSISLDEDEDDDDDDDDDDIFGTSSKAGEQKETYELMISTMYGSAFLDKKKKITCRWNDTIRDVKEQLSKKFAGSPAVALQHLYMGNRELRDDEIVANISTAALPMIPVQLDMMSGTSVYGKTMSIRQALEAYVATIVQHSYLSTELQTAYGTEPSVVDVSSSSNSSCSSSSSDKNRIIRTPYYQQLFYAVNRSIYEQYAEDIALALEEEREPEVISAETAAWRNQTAATRVSPLAAAIAKEFDLNWRGLRSFFYYSGVLAVFAMFGTTATWNTQIIMAMIPMLWMSKLRQLRLLWKMMLYIALPIAYHQDFLLPLLPAPLQVIAEHTAKQPLHDGDGDGNDAVAAAGAAVGVADLRKAVSAWSKKMQAKRHELRKTLFHAAQRMASAASARSSSSASRDEDFDEEEEYDDEHEYGDENDDEYAEEDGEDAEKVEYEGDDYDEDEEALLQQDEEEEFEEAEDLDDGDDELDDDVDDSAADDE